MAKSKTKKTVQKIQVELTPENSDQVSFTAKKIGRDPSFVVNEILNRFLIVPSTDNKKEGKASGKKNKSAA